jgi:acyl-CoA thioesterase FadM
MAAVLDEAMGVAGGVAGHAVVAVRLVTDFVQMLPLGTVVRVETEVRAAEGRKVPVEARLVGPEGAVHARSEGLFVTLGGASMDQLREVVDRIR